MKVLVSGYTGKMGQIVLDTFGKKHEIVAKVAIDGGNEAHCYKSFEEVSEEVDVVVDFSHHAGTQALMQYCRSHQVPVVVCTTGQSEEEKQMIREAGKQIPVFFSANMSLGVAVLCDLVKKAVAMFPDADVEILEVHHNRKIDVPSGTALMIANTIKEVRPNATFNVGRGNGKRAKEEIGISSLRMGNEVGTHEIYIHTENECITLRHNAYSRGVFADGALQAAEYLVQQKPGVYTMQDMIGNAE